MSDKVYKTHKQQLKILRSRGMNIAKGAQGSKAMRVLERENYYSVINGYIDICVGGHGKRPNVP